MNWIHATYRIFKFGVKPWAQKMRLRDNKKGKSIGSDWLRFCHRLMNTIKTLYSYWLKSLLHDIQTLCFLTLFLTEAIIPKKSIMISTSFLISYQLLSEKRWYIQTALPTTAIPCALGGLQWNPKESNISINAQSTPASRSVKSLISHYCFHVIMTKSKTASTIIATRILKMDIENMVLLYRTTWYKKS